MKEAEDEKRGTTAGPALGTGPRGARMWQKGPLELSPRQGGERELDQEVEVRRDVPRQPLRPRVAPCLPAGRRLGLARALQLPLVLPLAPRLQRHPILDGAPEKREEGRWGDDFRGQEAPAGVGEEGRQLRDSTRERGRWG